MLFFASKFNRTKKNKVKQINNMFVCVFLFDAHLQNLESMLGSRILATCAREVEERKKQLAPAARLPPPFSML